jgi:hypothetical protein
VRGVDLNELFKRKSATPAAKSEPGMRRGKRTVHEYHPAVALS